MAEHGRRDEFDCILCGKCLEVCPVFKATGREELGGRSKMYLAQLLAQPEPQVKLNKDRVAEMVGLCAGCERCEAACPRQVPVATVVRRLRAQGDGFRLWLYRRMVEHGSWWKKVNLLARILPDSLALPEPSMGDDATGLMVKGFRALDASNVLTPFIRVADPNLEYAGEDAALFAGCVADRVMTPWKTTALALMRHLGLRVHEDVPFGCCGSALASAGLEVERGKAMEANVRTWREAGHPRLVTFCASCHHELKGYAEYHVFTGVQEKALWLEKLTPLTSMLTGSTFVITEGAPESVAWHMACHEEPEADSGLFASQLLEEWLAASEDGCCGFGGALQAADPELSATIAGSCWARFGDTPTVLTGCSGCAMQLKTSAPDGREAGHWLEAVVPPEPRMP